MFNSQDAIKFIFIEYILYWRRKLLYQTSQMSFFFFACRSVFLSTKVYISLGHQRLSFTYLSNGFMFFSPLNRYLHHSTFVTLCYSPIIQSVFFVYLWFYILYSCDKDSVKQPYVYARLTYSDCFS